MQQLILIPISRYQSNLSDRILFFNLLVPVVFLESFSSSFHFLVAKYLCDMSLVVFT